MTQLFCASSSNAQPMPTEKRHFQGLALHRANPMPPITSQRGSGTFSVSAMCLLVVRAISEQAAKSDSHVSSAALPKTVPPRSQAKAKMWSPQQHMHILRLVTSLWGLRETTTSLLISQTYRLQMQRALSVSTTKVERLGKRYQQGG